MSTTLRYVAVRHGIPFLALVVTVLINLLYDTFPILEGLGAPKIAVLGILSGLLVHVAFLLDPNAGADQPWIVPPPA